MKIAPLFFFFLCFLGLLTAGCTVPESSESPLPPGARKCIAAPFAEGRIVFDGVPDEKIWKKAEFFSDFEDHKTGNAARSKTHVRIFHDREYLYIGLKCFDRKEELTPVNGHPNSLWKGDYVELIIGNLEPEPHSFQYLWGPGSTRYGANDNWACKSKIFDEYWTSETRIRLDSLLLHNACTGIVLMRSRFKDKIRCFWNRVGRDFQYIQNYAELIIGSYDLAARLKFRYYGTEKLSRRDYEKLRFEKSVPRHRITRGPWLFGVDRDAVSIAWCTAGRTGAFLEYRPAGTKEFTRVLSAWRYAAQEKDRKIHQVRLTGLIPGKTYEYRIGNMNKDHKDFVLYPGGEKCYSFTQHGKKDLSFLVLCDIHFDGGAWKELLDSPFIRNNCDLLVNLGDMISNSTGIESVFNGYLNAQLGFASRKPLLNFRGNHEYVGISPGTFFDVFGYPGFNGYGLHRLGDVCLIGLDVKNPDQRKWLEQAVKTPAFQTAKHRILLAHYPLIKKYSGKLFEDIDGIFTGKNAQRIDLLLSGHMHRSYFTPAGTETALPLEGGRKGEAHKVPFDAIVNEGPRLAFDNTALWVEARGDHLTVSFLDRKGKVLKTFKIR